MTMFLSYMLLGLSLAAPIGPINAAQMDKGIKYGFWNALMLGYGALSADVVYMLLVYFGLVHFVNTPFVQTFLWLFGCFVLIYTGIESLQGAEKPAETRSQPDEPLQKSFLSGFFMSLSNPLTILFWLGIYGSVLAKTAQTYGTKDLIIYSLAILAGIAIWDISMATVASSFRRFLAARTLYFISFISGISLIGFGLYFGWQAAKVLFGI
ncbi:LysE family transporter [Paenibacillus gansuensis]|uniref:LysE family transporter n=1 Tax=Paenibacillus gansuensis TaxID=306542 RepID=A0ABW5PE87_9BACL